ncbi:DUF3500 domain-containing protein [Micromonosporaceae bacterium B7E4]
MRTRIFLPGAALAVTLLAGCTTGADETAGPPASAPPPEPVTGASRPAGPTEAVVAAADAFLATLSPQQQDTVLYDAADPAVRQWSNLPVGSGGRNGVQFGDLTDEQRAAALRVAEAMLSADGYAELQGVIAAGDVLNARSGGNSSFSSDRYFIAFFGRPSTTARFTVQIGGHHLAVTTTYEDGRVGPTPAFTGVDPRFFEVAGAQVAPLRDEANAVFGLLGSLDADDRAAARIDGVYDDILVGAGNDGEFPPAAGVLVTDLPPARRDRVTTAIRAWVGDTDERAAELLMDRYRAEYGRTRIAWGGSIEPDTAGAYLRIDGPRLWIEFSNQGRTGNGDAVHYHSVYRDKQSDYASA